MYDLLTLILNKFGANATVVLMMGVGLYLLFQKILKMQEEQNKRIIGLIEDISNTLKRHSDQDVEKQMQLQNLIEWNKLNQDNILSYIKEHLQ